MIRGTGSLLSALLLLFIPATSGAQSPGKANHEPTPQSTQGASDARPTAEAARLFDRGVEQFSRGRYADAARAFIAADDLVPNPEALMNAVTAAHQAGDALLTAEAASRALNRPGMTESAVTAARRALALATSELATIDVQCDPLPCTIKLDGSAIAPGLHYVQPGDHSVVGSFAVGAMLTEHLTCVMGNAYQLVLEPHAQTSAAAPVTKTPLSRPGSRNGGIPDERGRAHATHGPNTRSTKPLSPAVFALGCVGTGALAALTTWSGMRVLSARKLHETNPDSYDPDEVRRLQRQTDVLLFSALGLGAATAAAGIWLVDFRTDTHANVALLPGGGVSIAAARKF